MPAEDCLWVVSGMGVRNSGVVIAACEFEDKPCMNLELRTISPATRLVRGKRHRGRAKEVYPRNGQEWRPEACL